MFLNTISSAYALVTTALMFSSPILAAPQETGASTSAIDGCTALYLAGLRSQLYYPGETKYVAREASYWSIDARIGPNCIIQPRNTAEVANVVKILSTSSSNFAVRSGGHSQWAGGSNIKAGITIDLGLLNTATYDKTTNVASLGPGSSWASVFDRLATNYGVTVTGGRDGSVGIGGFLTGGGNSYYTGRTGFGIDNVCNFEVVLTDGRIVSANKYANADLWKVLKGGSGNFGIVTRFDVEAFPAQDLWGGIRISNRTDGDALIDAFVKFTDNNEKSRDDAHIISFTYSPSMFQEITIAQILVSTTGVVNASSFDEIRAVPALFDDVQTRSMAAMANAYLFPANRLNIWFSLTFKNDARIIKEAARLHGVMVQEILASGVPADAFSTQSLFQPLPAYFAKIGVSKGGNVLGMDAVTTNSVLWLITADASTVAHEAILRPKVTAVVKAIEAYATKLSGNVAWKYLNYVDSTQNPLRSYGTKNFNLMLAAAKKYDPTGILQRKALAGFKLSKA
ncbi:hypothetical protein B0O99DRAFT_546392 [Bisporella sp. PMI_857]|nr:hypothetical protein B0O99DRAFT_546392 [Bisporella sp. PMI_857]